MQQRRLPNTTICLRCDSGTETMNHIFRECTALVSVWRELACQIFLSEYHLEIPQWLVWVFEQSNSAQCRIFCCILWAIWGDRNARVHKKVSKSEKEIISFAHSYISELNEIETSRPKVFPVVSKWKPPPDQFVKINFDATFIERSSSSALGVVARHSEGKVLLACSKIHNQD
ncbi:hypothetical protein Gotur_002646 [Gossypium turneri]